MKTQKEIIVRDGVYICPECGGRRITEISQNVLIKAKNINGGAEINPYTGRHYMSNRDKAFAYDKASIDGIGCWYYECRKCGWKSDLLTE